MDDCEKLNETALLRKEEFCSHLNMQNITYMQKEFVKTRK